MPHKNTNQKRPIETLIEASAKWHRGRSLKVILPRDVYREVEADLRCVVEAEREGKVVPSLIRLSKHVWDTYGMRVGKSGISAWLTRLREEK